MRKVPLVTGEYYHVYNRGVDRRCTFEDGVDYGKLYQSLYLFNDANYRNTGHEQYFNETLLAAHEVLQDERNPYVSVLSYCLMPNHFHLMLLQRQDGGISKFLHKLGIAYTQHFNKRYDRTGSLFKSTFKVVHVENDAQLLHLPRYVHCNALDLTALNWREGQVKDWGVAQSFLDSFPWSSHRVYMGDKQELPVIDLAEARKIFPDVASYTSFLKEWATRELPCDLVTPRAS